MLLRALPFVLALAATGCAHRGAAVVAPPPPPFTSSRADIHHALLRVTFGERPGDVERVEAMTLGRWLEEQLAPAAAEDASRAEAERLYPLAFADPLTLRFGAIDEAMEPSADDAPGMPASEPTPQDRRHLATVHAQMATLLRQASSERQLDEVLVDFWVNHFHVGIQKGSCAFTEASYVETAIRPHIRGRFEDMLVAVAHHPAMLVYLDNAQSSVARPGSTGDHGGLNENYARELLELHTLGVDGGYTQDDVRQSARVLTGWGEAELGFTFRQAWHDRGDKTVLGHAFAAHRGEDEGLELLHLLATHESTARFVSQKLLQRFVADEPSAEAVERVAAVFRSTDGDLLAVTRAVLLGPEFWAPEHRGRKVRSGLEFFLSLLRSTGAAIEDRRVLSVLTRLGQAPFDTLVPTGYPEVAAAWADPGRLSTRWAIVYQLANGNLPGVRFTLPTGATPDTFAARYLAPEWQSQ